ncbi:unnamed protein product [Microthlaspi erraticum]|uniref:Uncharacterized protein n=1 Tax=Microthlaspi erraticum TaxID=1685480 RepID=A0A6D2L590_9BRAS|nr:unnamed protein product [Microthlaspi erraticum]
MCISTQIVDCQLNLVLNQKSDRLEIPLQSLTPLICRLWANSVLKVRHTNPLHVPQHIQVGRHHQTHSLQLNKSRSPLLHLCHWRYSRSPCGTTGGKRANNCVSKPTTKSSDPEPEHHPTRSSPRSQTNTGITRHGYRLGHRRSMPHSVPHSLPNPPEVHTTSAPASSSSSATTALQAPRPLAPQPLATPSISLMEPKEHTRTRNQNSNT